MKSVVMKDTYDNESLINLIKNYGIISTLEVIDIEKIEDMHFKIIFRTIEHSMNTLIEDLNSYKKS